MKKLNLSLFVQKFEFVSIFCGPIMHELLPSKEFLFLFYLFLNLRKTIGEMFPHLEIFINKIQNKLCHR